MNVQVRPFSNRDRETYRSHAARSHNESGVGEPPFNPFEPGAVDLPREPDAGKLALPLSETGWLRLWVADHERDGIVGHMDLKGSQLAVGCHRCLLGIAIERPYRRGGLGRRLLQAAIDFVRREPSLEWIDLSVFSHNTPAIQLYRSLGFEEIGRVPDKFRISGESISDVLMALHVGAGPAVSR